MNAQASVDVVIFGGGIAGLWTLARLRQAGYSVVLLESDALGGTQTIAAQGIIHGGAKYALTGAVSDAAQAIGDMPQRWRDCLARKGELDLGRVRVLSQHQHLWSTEGIGSRMTGFFASKLMRSRMSAVEGADRPDLFQSTSFKGSVYRLEEPVLDLPSLVAELVRQHGDACFAVQPEMVQLDSANPGCLKIATPTGQLTLQAQQLLLAAGAGNEALLKKLGRKTPQMQRRPLHILMARGLLPPLYAHCLGASTNPRLTITSYPLAKGEVVWHLGGQVAERGVARDETEQITAGKAELATLLPWLDLTNIHWATCRVDRAEIATPGGRRPDSWHVDSHQGVITAWPTKLAFAPCLATDVLHCLKQSSIDPSGGNCTALADLPHPPLAQPPWDEVKIWN
ncbi:MAG: FAD-dependent oxidoreductase [Candidatus Polarisedimenticolaceae bacterium]|nr:FAD-dependent oxidoreductase [Candidatus Polarisedimenticolaceae bacterium]